MSIRTQMFEKDEMLAVIFKTSLELYKNALQRCEAGIVLYGSQYEIDIWTEGDFVYIDGVPSWAYDGDDARLKELLQERFMIHSILMSIRTGYRLYQQFLEDEAFEKYEKYE
tara:strand:- start:1665 stop:2000 length:336 start_codon:yes stop_codon:yes gene_type:complete